MTRQGGGLPPARAHERDEPSALKRDALGAILLLEVGGELLVRRDAGAAWSILRWVARRLLRREAEALRALAGLSGVPALRSLDPRGRTLDRSYLHGTPLHEAKPRAREFYSAARRLVVRMHRRGVAHNDLAKEPNWLVLDDGAPALVDFQLARVGLRRGRLARLMMREDLRHLLKHKRTYCREHLTPVELRLLREKSVLARVWRHTGKRAYNVVTRRLFAWRDREGRG